MHKKEFRATFSEISVLQEQSLLPLMFFIFVVVVVVVVLLFLLMLPKILPSKFTKK